MTPPGPPTTTSDARNNDIEDGDDAVEYGLENGGNAVHDAH